MREKDNFTPARSAKQLLAEMGLLKLSRAATGAADNNPPAGESSVIFSSLKK